jgi:Na+/H+ antiporter NhaD/arsenite permease-like protein
MGTAAVSTSHLPLWVIIAAWVYFAYRLLSSAKTEERKRRQQGKPHTRRDDALLLLAASSVVGLVLCAMFLKPLNVLVNSRAGIAATILLVGGGLTYIFNRGRAPRS